MEKVTKFKGKIEVWIMAFVAAFVITNIGSMFSCMGEALKETREPVEISLVTNDTHIIENVSSITSTTSTTDGEGFIATFSVDNMNADVIISSSILDDTLLDTYKQIGVAHSPIVLVGGDWLEETSSFFNIVKQNYGSYDYNTYSCDFEDLAKAILDDKTWVDLGIKEKIIKGNISLVIPKLNTIEGKYVYNYIFNSFKNMYPNKSEEEILQLTNTLIGKTRQSSSITMEMNDYYDNTDDSAYSNCLWLIPEHIIALEKKAFDKDISYQLYPIYLNNTISCGYYVYAKNDDAFIEKFNKYGQELIMYDLTIRYGNDNFVGMHDAYRSFKSILNHTIVYYDELLDVNQSSAQLNESIGSSVGQPIIEETKSDVETSTESGENETTSESETTESQNSVENVDETEVSSTSDIETNDTMDDTEIEETLEELENVANEAEEDLSELLGGALIIILLFFVLTFFIWFVIDVFWW